MVGSGPTAEELERIFAIAARTPDHGKLHPWRFVVVGHEQRDAFGALLRQALAEEDPCATIAHHEKEDAFARQGGALIVLISAPTEGHKIPVWEQQLSSGAAGMNLLHAAHALGFAASWVTRWYAFDAEAAAMLGAGEGERIVGFVQIGTPTAAIEDRPRPDLAEIVSRWSDHN